MQEIIVTPNALGKIFGRFVSIKLDSDSLVATKKNGSIITLSLSKISDIPSVADSLFGSKLHIKCGECSYSFPLLKRSQSRVAIKWLEEQAIKHISLSIQSAHNAFTDKAINEYLRDSSVVHIEEIVGEILSNYTGSESLWASKLDNNLLTKLSILGDFFPLSEGKAKLRESYEAKQLSNRKHFFDLIESNPLTEQQRLSVIRNNDLNLVLAAAGTGKTSVMVAKALDLIESGEAKNSDVLLLAYNNAASKELDERIILRGKAYGATEADRPKVSTFHALGRKILKECGINTYLSDFSNDPVKLEVWVTQWLVDYIKSSPDSLKRFLALSYQPVSPFDFESKEEYDAYIRDNEYRTLQGERVRGYQELLIANWLFMNNVEYEYEAPYVTKRRIDIGFDYRPDFHIANTNIYIEHFGIDRDGNTRSDINRDEYNNDIKNKRLLHTECQTSLLETYHYDWAEDNLENRLLVLMSEAGIKTSEKPPEEIFETLKDLGLIEKSAKRYLKCLQAIRVERLEDESILLRLEENSIVSAQEYTELLGSLHSAYKDELETQKRIDFDDMIIRSTDAITSGHFVPKWRHILVDEFQDISAARMDFIRALINHGPTPLLTAVGDDWQSIYRFSGGKLELMTRFEELVGSHTLTKLDKTFRYNNSIADIAGTFVMQNPEQYSKNVVTHTQVNTPQVYLLDSKVGNEIKPEEQVAQILKVIKDNDPDGSVAVLARYRYLLGKAKEAVINTTPFRDIKYWTFHGSKGLEADYCVLIGFFQGKTGFPNMNKEEALVEALLPSLDTYPHSEERRLLYVALTRAKNKSYLIADPMAPSEFITELLTPKYELHIASNTFKEKFREIFKCPICTTGYFRKISGKFGDFYSCTSGSICPSKPRICDKCGSPSLDTRNNSICNNHDCKNEKAICERCGRPMKLRDGKFGQFWGCTGYGIKHDQCKHTRKYFQNT